MVVVVVLLLLLLLVVVVVVLLLLLLLLLVVVVVCVCRGSLNKINLTFFSSIQCVVIHVAGVKVRLACQYV